MTISDTARAILLAAHGGPEVLQLKNVEVHPPAAGEVTLSCQAAGVNFIDVYFRTGLYPHELPHGLGFEGAGIIEAVGEGVDDLKVGDRVAHAMGPLGSYAERRTMPAATLVKLPDAISYEQGAAIMMKGLTAQYLLRQTYPVQPGETILFHAAAGGVGQIACQWARHLGVKLIGTASSDEKTALAAQNGAWQTINYSKEDVVEKVLELTDGKGVPVVFDGVGRSTWDVSLACLQPRGMMVNFGNASGPVTGVDLSVLQKKALYVTRPGIGAYLDTRPKLLSAAQDLFDLMTQDKIQASISRRFKLDEAALAHELLESRLTTGSCIIDLSGDAS